MGSSPSTGERMSCLSSSFPRIDLHSSTRERPTGGANLSSAEIERLPVDRNYRSTLPLLPQANISYFGDDVNLAGSTGAEVVYAQVADFHRWDGWSPWARLDPNQRTEFEGPPSGLGAGYHWAGNAKVGEGRMTVTAAAPPRELAIRLQFIKPWAQISTSSFTFAPEGTATRVTWAMSGSFDLLGRAMTLFMDMDRQVGPDFEKGLAAMKKVAEEQAGGAPLTPR